MSERVCPHCGAPLEGVSIYDDTICDYCGSEVKGEKREETQTPTQRVREKSKYRINWVDTYVTDSNYTNRQRCVAIPKGEKRALKFKVYFDAVREDAIENARLAFFSFKTRKIVAEDMIKTELKKGDTTITYQKPIGSFDEGEYWVGLTLDGGTDFFMFKLIIGNAPRIKEYINTAGNREVCAQRALNMCRTRKLSAAGMIPVQSNIINSFLIRFLYYLKYISSIILLCISESISAINSDPPDQFTNQYSDNLKPPSVVLICINKKSYQLKCTLLESAFK